MKTKDIKAKLKEHELTNELWIDPNNVIEVMKELIKLRGVLKTIRQLAKEV